MGIRNKNNLIYTWSISWNLNKNKNNFWCTNFDYIFLYLRMILVRRINEINWIFALFWNLYDNSHMPFTYMLSFQFKSPNAQFDLVPTMKIYLLISAQMSIISIFYPLKFKILKLLLHLYYFMKNRSLLKLLIYVS